MTNEIENDSDGEIKSENGDAEQLFSSRNNHENFVNIYFEIKKIIY